MHCICQEVCPPSVQTGTASTTTTNTTSHNTVINHLSRICEAVGNTVLWLTQVLSFTQPKPATPHFKSHNNHSSLSLLGRIVFTPPWWKEPLSCDSLSIPFVGARKNLVFWVQWEGPRNFANVLSALLLEPQKNVLGANSSTIGNLPSKAHTKVQNFLTPGCNTS